MKDQKTLIGKKDGTNFHSLLPFMEHHQSFVSQAASERYPHLSAVSSEQSHTSYIAAWLSMPAFTADDLRFLILWDLDGGSPFSFGQCNTESEENEHVVRNSASVAEQLDVTHLCAGTLCAPVNHPWQHGAAARALLCLLCSLLIILNEIIHEVMLSIRYSRESVLWIHKFLAANM